MLLCCFPCRSAERFTLCCRSHRICDLPSGKNYFERQIESLRRGYIENFEIESARSLLQARLLGIAEDREAFFRFQLREGLVGGGQSPEKLWRSVERVGIDDLVRVANHLKADTAYLLYAGRERRSRYE